MKLKMLAVLLAAMGIWNVEADAQERVPPKAVLDNGVVRREVDLSGGKVRAKSYKLVNETEFLQSGSREFSFLANDRLYTGLDAWADVQAGEATDRDGSKTMTVIFREPQGAFAVELAYTVYPKLAMVRKTLAVTNLSDRDLKLEAVNVEDFGSQFSCCNSYLLRRYARSKYLGKFVGDWADPLVMVQNHGGRIAMAIGNETPGVIKRTGVFEDGSPYGPGGTIRVGVTAPGQPYPFRRWLKKGQRWQSAAVFTAVARGSTNPHVALDPIVDQYVRKYMGIRLEQISRKPVFVYNTWIPFTKNVNDQLVRDLAKAAAECGVEEFVIDDGWQSSYGEWGVDKKKFPHGLKPVFDYIKSLGMKPGLWITLGSATTSSAPFKQHPEWFVRDAKGNFISLHDDRPNIFMSACMTTGWRDHIRDIILGLVRDHGLAYVKVDFAMLTSAYVYDYNHSGCRAKDHPGHRDWQESFDTIYAEALRLFDELHAAAPELYIDCTYENVGKMQLMDYGFARHADGNWLSNIGTRNAYGAWDMRNLAWWRTPALPATSLVIGNLRMDDEMSIHSFKSLAGALPIMLGDPRRFSAEKRAEFKRWSAWLKGLEARHGIMSFRQDLPGFGEPTEGRWDGFARINVDTKSGGLVGVFRENAVETTRTVTVRGLDPVALYEVRRLGGSRSVATASVAALPGGSRSVATASVAADTEVVPPVATVAQMCGADLMAKGFPVTITDNYGGELFEIIRVANSATPPQVRIETLKPLRSQAGWGNGIRLGSGYDGSINLGGCPQKGGMAIHADGFATFARDPQWKRVVATVGIDEAHRPYGQSSMVFRIVAEQDAGETVIAKSPKLSFGGCEAWHFDCEIPSDAKRIRFEVDGAGDGNHSDHGHWAECGFR